LFFVAERLQKSVVVVERMSNREVAGWLAWFTERSSAPDDDDGALDPRTATPAQLRGAFK